MAARASVSEEEHIVFLLSCVRNANAGQVNFSNVAKECQIVSVGAAAKRFSRLTKKYRDGGAAAATDNHENGSAEDTAQPKPAAKTTTTKRANASGKGAAKAEKASKKSATATAPLAAGVTKKRSGNKKVQFTSVTEDQIVKSEEEEEEGEGQAEDMSAFFNAQIGTYL